MNMQEDEMVNPPIGAFRAKTPFFLAPMAGYTDSVYRGICSKMGASLVYSEMVSAQGLVYSNKKTERLLRIGKESAPCAYQIFGKDPEIMKRAAEILEPYPNVIIDINMGCPVKKIVSNGEGSALLRDPDRIYRIVRAVSGVTDKPVTAKIRIGIEGAGTDAAVCAAQAVEAGGGAAVAVHGRTREQFYEGFVDLERIGEVKRAVSIPVIGNGDILSYDDAMRMKRKTNCDYLMVGRGALGDPWIFERLNAAYASEKIPDKPGVRVVYDMIISHLKLLVEEEGEYIALRLMRKFVGKYIKGVSGAAEIRREINHIEDIDDFVVVLKRNLIEKNFSER
jgi:tRNA-dihydrouridine synthase B